MALIQAGPDEIVNEASSVDLEQIRKWNETVTSPVEACIHHLIEKQVRDQPDDEAVCSRDGSLTYRELDAYANLIASRLVYLGIRPDDLVPFCFEKSMWTVVAMLAILKAGAAFVPIPHSPVQRIKTMLSLIKPTVILTSTQQEDIFVGLIEHVIAVGKSSCDKVEAAELERVEVDSQPSNLAYVMFTSGSTGTPKVSRKHFQTKTLCDQGPDLQQWFVIRTGNTNPAQPGLHSFENMGRYYGLRSQLKSVPICRPRI